MFGEKGCGSSPLFFQYDSEPFLYPLLMLVDSKELPSSLVCGVFIGWGFGNPTTLVIVQYIGFWSGV